MVSPFWPTRPKLSPKGLSDDMLKWWDADKNKALGPASQQGVTSKHYAWWRCEQGHQWHEKIITLYQRKNCQYCERKLPSATYNLALVNPGLASEWHPRKNKDLKPEGVLPNAYQRVWWLCPCGQEWTAIISQRHAGKSNCPQCQTSHGVQTNKLISKPVARKRTQVDISVLALSKQW